MRRGRSPHDGMGALINEAPEGPSSFLQAGLSTEVPAVNRAVAFLLDSSPQSRESKCSPSGSPPAHGILSEPPEQAETPPCRSSLASPPRCPCVPLLPRPLERTPPPSRTAVLGCPPLPTSMPWGRGLCSPEEAAEGSVRYHFPF